MGCGYGRAEVGAVRERMLGCVGRGLGCGYWRAGMGRGRAAGWGRLRGWSVAERVRPAIVWVCGRV